MAVTDRFVRRATLARSARLLAEFRYEQRDPARFWSYYRPRFQQLGDKRPNAAHMAIAELERRGLVRGVITQNIDRLHRAAGSVEVVEVHGSIASSSCRDCGASFGVEQVEGLFDDDGIEICRGWIHQHCADGRVTVRATGGYMLDGDADNFRPDDAPGGSAA